MANDILVYDDFFSDTDLNQIIEYVSRDRWFYGHGTYTPDQPEYKGSTPFWGMYLEKHTFFTEYLLNIIQQKLNKKFSLYTVYANGHTFGTKGKFHQDWYTPEGKTLLLYLNDWNDEWGGSTIFKVNDTYSHVYPAKNRVVYFPGEIYHCADATNREFNGLRITLAWKLISE
jgi:2OG-Fe(II) oxygenase superfamily